MNHPSEEEHNDYKTGYEAGIKKERSRIMELIGQHYLNIDKDRRMLKIECPAEFITILNHGFTEKINCCCDLIEEIQK